MHKKNMEKTHYPTFGAKINSGSPTREPLHNERTAAYATWGLNAFTWYQIFALVSVVVVVVLLLLLLLLLLKTKLAKCTWGLPIYYNKS